MHETYDREWEQKAFMDPRAGLCLLDEAWQRIRRALGLR